MMAHFRKKTKLINFRRSGKIPSARGDRLLGLESLDGVGEESAQTIHGGDQVLEDKTCPILLAINRA